MDFRNRKMPRSHVDTAYATISTVKVMAFAAINRIRGKVGEKQSETSVLRQKLCFRLKYVIPFHRVKSANSIRFPLLRKIIGPISFKIHTLICGQPPPANKWLKNCQMPFWENFAVFFK